MTGWKCVGSVDAFKAGKYEVLVANAATIAHGYNLQNSCSILFYSNSFSLEKRLQIEGRIFRLGQKQPCLYTDYVYEDSIDEKIYAVLKMKRDLLEYIRDADMRELLT
jgi:SNF2 family DNA or RNA helicase